MAATATATATSARTSTPPFADLTLTPDRTSTPPPPAAKPIPSDFKSSLSAWWNNASYKEARYAEERLLRRMEAFQAAPREDHKGWFGWGHSVTIPTSADSEKSEKSPVPATTTATATPSTETPQQVNIGVGGGLVATLRNVFIPTPDPSTAPAHPADPLPESTSTASSPAASISSESKHKHHHHHRKHHHKHEDYINTLEISSPENKNSKEAVVVLHGYAAALGFFFRNWESVSQTSNATGRRTFFLDWLGMGLSSRPAPNLLNSPSSTHVPARVARAEHFFLSSLESWRESVGVDKMVLVGHSLGGYLASAYAVRYPHRVSGLILVSPAGIPHGPDYKKYKPLGERNDSDNLDDAVEAAEMEMNQNEHQAKGEARQWQKDQTATRKYMMKFFVWSWEKGVSPFTFLRNMGPWGPMFAARYTQRRFGAQSEEDRRDIHSYIYNTSILKGSGEYCISHLLAPGAYARIPIVDRIGGVKVPVTFLYGDNDWMDVDGGHASVKELEKAGNFSSKVHVVPKAGHHLYLDNPEVTNKLLDDAIKALPKLNRA